MLLGTLSMFQPWFLDGFRAGFLLLLGSTLAFILWSHVTPRASPRTDEPRVGSLPEAEGSQR
jgi:hypothetical protein